MNDSSYEIILSTEHGTQPSLPELYVSPVPQAQSPSLNKDDEILEADESFDLDSFQVVRREFFAHLREPSVTFSNLKFYVNSACLQKFPNVDRVQILVNRETKILALMPCPEDAVDSYTWTTQSGGKRKPRQISCPIFFAMIFTLMDWNPANRYKLLGKLIHSNGEYLIAFDLNASEMYERTQAEGQKPKMSRKPVFPAEWKNQFGLSFKEHQQSMKINVFDGFAVYSVQDNKKVKSNDFDIEKGGPEHGSESQQ